MKKEQKMKFAIVAVMAIVGLTALAFLPANIVVKDEPGKVATWNALGDADPGAGAGGFLSIVVMELPEGVSVDTSDNASFATNLSYIEADAFDVNIPHSVKLGVYITARFNTTQAYSAINATWVDAWTRCKMTGLNVSIAAETVMNRTKIAESPDFMWVRFYLEQNSTDEPIMLARDQVLDFAAIMLEAYY